ncbi:hypothetical protein ATZ33_17410 [Enterococcus silesiacus]|nr:hypothetical protein [Enterococcus silesiacus]ALS03089.1 hypothetical protein ATZ33_17410 [Enterococcus silesiacus]
MRNENLRIRISVSLFVSSILTSVLSYKLMDNWNYLSSISKDLISYKSEVMGTIGILILIGFYGLVFGLTPMFNDTKKRRVSALTMSVLGIVLVLIGIFSQLKEVGTTGPKFLIVSSLFFMIALSILIEISIFMMELLYKKFMLLDEKNRITLIIPIITFLLGMLFRK